MQTESERLEEAMATRSRYMRRVRENRTVDERLAEFRRPQQASFRVLLASPHGYQHFLKRNMNSRRVEVIDGEWIPLAPARRALQP
jgi:hypothetical protein